MRVRAVYEKGDRVRFLGHLDVARCIRLALRRAEWPLEMSKGFSPKPRISVYAPLPVGVAGMREYFDAVLRGHPDMRVLARRLASSLPEGFALHELYALTGDEAPFEESVRASSYSVDMEGVKAEALRHALDRFLEAPQVFFDVRRPKEVKTVDLRPFVLGVGEPEEVGVSRVVLDMVIAHDKGRTVRPQWVLSSLGEFGLDVDPREAIIDRRKIIFG
jgi:radical SAM-linked protein